MLLNDAKLLLADCAKAQLRDHYFGDREITWHKNGITVATGYFGGGVAHVQIKDTLFKGKDAYILDDVRCEANQFERNDSEGDDIYRGA